MNTFNYNYIAGLVRKVKEKDNQAFADLYSETYQHTYFFILSMVKNPTLAEDLVQDVYIKILSGINSLNDDKLFISWLNRIAYHETLNYLGKEGRTPTSELLEETLVDKDDSHDPMEVSFRNETQREVYHFIMELSPTLRATVIMRYYDNMKISEIADVLDCPPGTVKSRLNAAKAQLRRSIEGERSGKTLKKMVLGIPISTALFAASQSLPMNTTAASAALMNVLSANGMGTNVTFTPKGVSGGGTAASSIAKTAGACVGTGVVALGALVCSTLTPAIPKVAMDQSQFVSQLPVSIHADGAMPVKNLYVTAPGGEIYQVSSQQKNDYLFTATENGTYEITLVGMNGQTVSDNFQVDCIDRMAPTVRKVSASLETLVLSITDSQSQVDFGSVHGIGTDGSTITPLSVNEESGTVTFAYPEGEFTLYVTDLVGNQSEYQVSPIA